MTLQRTFHAACAALLAAAALLASAPAAAQNFTLTVQWAGPATGNLQAAGTPIFCTNSGGTCTASIPSGQAVTVQASVFLPSYLASWSGCDTYSLGTCNVTMTADRTIVMTSANPTATNEPVQSQVRPGDGFTCALDAAGAVQCMGKNTVGQLGNGDATHTLQPGFVPVSGLGSGVVDIATGINHACAVLATGGVRCWGANTGGQLGDGTTTSRDAPVDVFGITDAVQVTVGYSHSCALSAVGTVKCWGQGPLGDNTIFQRLTPVEVIGLPEIVTEVRAGASFTCALTAAGNLRCWGSNFDGQLGNGTPSSSVNVPVTVSGISNVASFGVGLGHACATTNAGAVFCWGSNARGQLGDGTNTSRSVPTAVTAIPSGAANIGVAVEQSCVAMTDGSVKCWGANFNGQLGDGTATNRNAPVDVAGFGGAASLSLGAATTCSLQRAGRVACWGAWYNPNGTNVDLPRPRLLPRLGGITSLASGFNHACVATSQGARCSGYRAGDGTTEVRARFVDVQQLNVGTVSFAVGNFATCFVTNAGEVRCWGEGDQDLLGRADSQSLALTWLPMPATGLSSGVTSVSMIHNHACAVQAGVVKCWGQNDKGQLGLGIVGASVAVPGAINFAGGFDAVAAGRRSTCALRSGGVLCWGDNSSGQMGTGDFAPTEVLAPTAPLGLASGVVSVVAGDQFYCALKTDGSVLCWGNNGRNQLGRGPVPSVPEHTPVVVTGLTSGVVQITAYAQHACALMTDNAVKCWGNNSNGQVGDGTTSQSRNVPTDVLNLGPDVQLVSAGVTHTCVLTWSGTVRCWGGNLASSFGTGDGNNSLSPTAGVVGQSIAFSPATTVTTGASTPLTATASSGLAVAYASTTPNCTISGSNLTLASGGRCGIAASQPGDPNWFAAPVKRAVTTAAGLSAQPITFGNLFDRFTVEGPFAISATGGGSGNAITFTSLTTGICTTGGTNGATVSLVGAVGNCVIQANQAGNASFVPGRHNATFKVQSASVNVTVNKGGTGTGTVTGNGINCGATCTISVTGGSFQLTATPNPNNNFTGWSGCNGVSGNTCTVTISGFSNRTITANFAVTNVAQAITFNPDTLPDQNLANFQYFFQASASSNLAVTITTQTPAVCTVQSGPSTSNHSLSLITAGTCTVNANQAGNATFAPAPTVTRSFTVTPRMYQLNLATGGTGSGKVTGNGLDCGSSCSATFAEGTPIALTATPNAGSTFAGWDSCPAPVGNRCNFTLDFPRTIGANFEPAAAQGPFQPGNLVVYRVGDGAGALTADGNAVFLDEYRTNGTIRQTIVLPTAASGAQAALIASGTATGDGLLTRSSSRNCLVVPGYGRALGGSGDLTTSNVPRIIGVISSDGDVDTTTALGDASSASAFRSATSADCDRLYGSGAGSGVRTAPIGATTSTDLTGTTAADSRAIAVADGQLYVSGASGSLQGVATVGAGVPVTGPQAVATLTGLSNANLPNGHGFVFIDQDGSPGADTLYVADEDQGIRKFSNFGGTWTLTGTVGDGTQKYRGLTGVFQDGFVKLYATRKANTAGATPGGELVQLLDFCGFGGPLCGPVDVIAVAPDNTAFRGVAFAPDVTVTPTASANATISPDTPQVVAGGATPSFTVGVDSGYTLVMGGTCGGTLVGTTYTINPALVNCTVTVTATLPGFTVTPSADTHSTITPGTPQQVATNAQAVFTVGADAGYSFTVGGTCGGTLAGTTYTTNAVTQDCTVAVTSAPITYTVTSSAGANGSITPLGAQSVGYNQTATFTVTPDSGYTAAVNGTCGGALTGTSYTTAVVTANCTVVASFSLIDTTPDTFSFNDVANVDPGAVVTSNAIVVAGIAAPAAISVTGGAYSIGCTASFTAAAGTIAEGQTVCVRHTAPAALSATTDTTLTIGGVSDTFSSTTVAALPANGDFDGDGIPNAVEAAESRNPFLKDNDIFGVPRLFAMQMYRDFLGREGDAGGVQFYIDLLNNGAATREQVIESFLASPEFANGLPPVIRLYFSFFNRIPDYDGLVFQGNALRSGTPLEVIAQNFYNAPEFTNTYGALSNDQYIEFVYQNVLGRPSDPGGFAFYKNLLDNNIISKGQMMIGFSESPEFQQLMENESWIISVYVGLLRRAPEGAGLAFYNNLLDNGTPRSAVIPGFYNSPEYRSRFLP